MYGEIRHAVNICPWHVSPNFPATLQNYRSDTGTLYGSILDEAGKLLNQHRALSHPCSTDTLTQRGSPSASEIYTQQKKTRNPISTRFKNSILYVRFDICICVINYASNWISAYKGNNWWWRIAILFIFKKELEIQVGKEEQSIWEYWISQLSFYALLKLIFDETFFKDIPDQ